jgi:hypothetical protein
MDATSTAAPSAVLPPETRCYRCNYDLQTLDPGSNCPECGEPIVRTLTFGLGHADKDWLRRQSRTMFLLIALCVLEYGVLQGNFLGAYGNLVILAGFAVAAVVACWRLSVPEPGRADFEGRGALARGLRLAIVAYTAGLVLLLPPVVDPTSRTWSLFVFGWLGALVLSTWLAFVIILQYTRRTARRGLIIHARLVAWSLPISKVLAYGTPVAVWLYGRYSYQDALFATLLGVVSWASTVSLLAAVALLGRMHEVFRAASLAAESDGQ